MDAAAVVEPKPATQTDCVQEMKGSTVTSAVKEDTIVNRETKLALLIGFVAIVVVTVLVGEHFGKARNTVPATVDLGTSNAATPSVSGLTVDPITATPVATPSAPFIEPTGGAGAPAQPVTITSVPAPVNTDPNRFIPAAGVDSSSSRPAFASGGEIPGTIPVATIGEPAAPTFGGRPLSAGVEKMHPLQRGETFTALAQRYYGDKSLAAELSSYNAKRISSNGTIREGVTLRIPPMDVLMGTAVLSPTASGQTGPTSAPPALVTKPASRPAAKPTADKAKSTGPRTYVVKKGDTLMHIAQRELGSTKRWEALLTANPGLDENSLRPGSTIKIPATK